MTGAAGVGGKLSGEVARKEIGSFAERGHRRQIVRRGEVRRLQRHQATLPGGLGGSELSGKARSSDTVAL